MKLLFLDDVHIQERPGLRRVLHQPEKVADGPIVVPDRPWEVRDGEARAGNGNGSVVFDPDDRVFKMWYETWGPDRAALSIAYATSTDGILWEKPTLGIVDYEGSRANNLVLPLQRAGGTSMSAFKDPGDPDPSRRYKLFYADNLTGVADRTPLDEGIAAHVETPRRGGCAAFSPDGIHWTTHPDNPVWPFKPMGPSDSLRSIYDRRRGYYACYDKVNREVYGRPRRVIALGTSADFVHWSEPQVVLQPDEEDPLNADFYGMPVVIYEGVYVGTLWVFHTTPELEPGIATRMHGRTDVQLATSRDGVAWTRVADRQTFIPLGAPGTYEAGQLATLTTGGDPILLDDRIYVYYGASSGRMVKHNAALYLATLRRDGFVSLDADGLGGYLLTTPIELTGRELALNVAARHGMARVGLLDEAGQPIAGFAIEDCSPISRDALRHPVIWGDRRSLDGLRRRRVRLRLELRHASLYSVEQVHEPGAVV